MNKEKGKNPVKPVIFALAGIVFIVIVWLLIKSGGNKNEVSCSTNAERTAFLSSFGWEVSETPVEVNEIVIPGEFNEVYLKYNDIQRLQGFDLRKYKGKPCVKYTYRILNYPAANGLDDSIIADILVLDGRVIGGDVCSPELGGFMHGFAKE